ncbi:MAG: alanine:cation symporter family protein [Sphingomonadaceae bacterium]|uniref:alanine/glycine:cation symporter family protein n=1 Tax=Thermaurantiacus sp. TaxID=2820283 RepID=UPI00298EEE43|nr:amino acid carrier protein [Thermaurantiacus sp.]MCS6987712.1 alanine:cation symporter family protein [Sphingomonadaceae bacterium]MDW8415069.1 amino acid carrier protein [Thermaurantiacus sp.]
MPLADWASFAIQALAAAVFAEIPVAGVPVQLVVLWLAAAMVFTTVWLRCPQLRGFRLAFRVLAGRLSDPRDWGAVSPFQALSTALASTVGLGNIAGVAVAVATGGPGAIFWMGVIGVFAMALKCAEVTLGLMYRERLPSGRVMGGPAITLMNGLAAAGLPGLGRFLARAHALFMILGCLSLFQINQAHAQVSVAFGWHSPVGFGVGFALLVALVLMGSVAWIGRVAGRLVPTMCLLYVLACLVTVLAHLDRLPEAFARILLGAFSPEGVAGGALGVFVVGMRRAVYSSEAGIGTAVVAHAQARTREPASEGLVALIEPFVDTVVICTLSGLTLVVTGLDGAPLDGVAMTSAALSTAIPSAPAVLAVVVFLFAYSTVLANGFYAAEAFQFLVGHGRVRELAFKAAFCLVLPLGTLLKPQEVLDLVDSAFFLMAIPNVLGIYLLARPLRAELEGYLSRMSRARPRSSGRSVGQG